MPVTFTILGSRGYVGSHLATYLRESPDVIVNVDEAPLPRGGLGHIIYCIGVTSDFASRLHDTMRAHVCKVMDVLETCEYESFTYLSSTRVYERGVAGQEETSLATDPASVADYYKISKIAGEAVCLANPKPVVRVVRLSNVIGFEQPPLTFVPSLIRDALRNGKIVLNTALDSAKDYVLMEDVVRALALIAERGSERIYNLSSGQQTTHEQIVRCICGELNCSYEAKLDGVRSSFPETPATKLSREFGFQPQSVLDKLSWLCRRYAETRAADLTRSQ